MEERVPYNCPLSLVLQPDILALCPPPPEQLQRLDMEARSFSPDQSRAMTQKVKEYRADLRKLKEDVKKAATGTGLGSSGVGSAQARYAAMTGAGC